MAGLTERFEMRLDQDTVQAVEAWRTRQSDMPSRAEAIRRLIEQGLGSGHSGPLGFSKAEMLIVHMLCELYKGLKIKSEIDPEFVRSALFGGHLWGLEWKYTGIFRNDVDSQQAVKEVVDILDMWDFVESGYEKLDQPAKDLVAKEAEPFGTNVAFHGFDANNETGHLGIARFLIDDMERFSRFKGRALNSHSPSVDAHRRMLHAFLPIREKLIGRGLNDVELVEILKARIHPTRRKT